MAILAITKIMVITHVTYTFNNCQLGMVVFMEIMPEVYQGQFGEFTITKDDRLGVIVYRSALAIAALCFSLGVLLVLIQPSNLEFIN